MKHLLLFISIFSTVLLGAQEMPASYVWHYTVGGPGDQTIGAHGVDGDGNVIIAGSYADSILIGDSIFVSEALFQSGFIAKLDADAQLIWARQLRMTDGIEIEIYDMEVFGSGAFAIAGSLNGTVDADIMDGEFPIESEQDDIFLAVYDADGAVLLASSIRGMNSNEQAFDLTFDGNEALYLSGYISDEELEDSPILVKVNIGENPAIEWSYVIPTEGRFDEIGGLVATTEHVYITGNFQGVADFDGGDGEFLMDGGELPDAFVAKLTTNGEFVWAKQFAPLNDDANGQGIVLDAEEAVYVTGWFGDSTDFDPNEGEFWIDGGVRDPFIMKLSSDGELIWADKIDAFDSEEIEIDSNGDIIFAGESVDGLYIQKVSSDGELMSFTELLATSLFGYEFSHFTIDNNDDMYISLQFSDPFFFNPATSDSIVSTSDDDILLIKLTGNEVTSIIQSLPIADVAVYPNPIIDQVNIEWNQSNNNAYKVFVLDIEGRVIAQHDFVGDNLANIPFPYVAGSYFIQIAESNELYRPIKVLKP